ncbi:MAG: hypothetical protein AB1483_06490 [Candidatus Zixiibacteriota bacterium]
MFRLQSIGPGSFILLSCLVLLSGIAIAIQPLISYQGRITGPDGTPVNDGEYSAIFRIYADSVGGQPIWTEAATVTAVSGLFEHRLGSTTEFPAGMFTDNENLFLETEIDGAVAAPRSRLLATPFALAAGGLNVSDTSGRQMIVTSSDQRKLAIVDTSGTERIVLRDADGDGAVVLPGSSISATELASEPGIAGSVNIYLMTLTTGSMTDLATVTITTPDKGYIVLYGKCYIMLSGTVGPNTAIVQIDENEGGGTQYPYFTVAGLSGYVNTGVNYFPAFVSRVYYKSAGTYTFRLEGRANNDLPATARTWDHVLTAVYFPTSYWGVGAVLPDASWIPGAVPIEPTGDSGFRSDELNYEVDLRQLERLDTDN